MPTYETTDGKKERTGGTINARPGVKPETPKEEVKRKVQKGGDK